MNKNAIKKFAIEARQKLIASVTDKAGMLGITAEGVSAPTTKGNDFEVYQTAAGTEVTLNKKQCEQRRRLVEQIESKGFEEVVEEVAYTWFNRICAIRFMEVNDYLPSRVRALSSEKEGKNEPDLVTQAPDVELDLTDTEKEFVIESKMSGKLVELFAMLFVKQCNKLHEVLPELFEETSDYTEMLLSISFTNKDDVIRMLIDEVPEEDFNITTVDEKGNVSGQVEIIGWLYQYYNTELKDDTFAKLKKNIKITKERIPAATQLFTPDWIVRYMVENSVGRLWIEHLRAVDPSVDEKKTAEEFGWKYYLPEAEQEESVNQQLATIRVDYKNMTPEDITCIDPCMGSGHILVAMFDVLMDIYKSAGYSERDAALLIVQKNIHGLDLDERAYQLAYFAVMMKGRQHNRRFLKIGEEQPKPMVYAIQESNDVNKLQLKFFGSLLPEIEKNNALNQMQGLLDELIDAKEYGSILDIGNYDWRLLKKFVEEYAIDVQISFDTVGVEETQNKLRNLVKQGHVMAQKYNVVVTNPPYMGIGGGNYKLNNFVKEKYNNSKNDLFAVFIEKANKMVRRNGYQAMITMHSWMFIGTFETLRKSMLKDEFVGLLHLGIKAFEEIGNDIVQTCTFVIRKTLIEGKSSVFVKLDNYKNYEDKKNAYLNKLGLMTSSTDKFSSIPGSVFAYWVNDGFINNFSIGTRIEDYSQFTGSQNITGDNEKYLRFFWEISDSTLNDRWRFYAKGGDYRQYYGNLQLVVDWSNAARQFYKDNKTSNLLNEEFWYKEGITYSAITSRGTGFRYLPKGCIFDKGGPSINVNSHLFEILALLNSNVAKYYFWVFNPSINLQVKDIKNFPIILPKDDVVKKLAIKNVEIAKLDWDSVETSIDFKAHPLIGRGLISNIYEEWEKKCKERFNQLKQNEIRINDIFAELYNMKNEISSEVEDREVSVRHADLDRDIRSLISYAVGCMFGRYSLDLEGISYAGGEWEVSKYKVFAPDMDNVIPITDDEYFGDDIVGRFCEWLKVVYGEEVFEENLDFIAKNLGNKGDSSREIIRNYFLKDFENDHLKVYQKCPIYWLFDAGKEDGFKALIYMHRYTSDTVGIVRTDYLHKTQKAIEQAMQRAEYTSENASSASDKKKAVQLITKYTKQLAQMKSYDEAMAHIANQRIEIDLDDGVKVNYEKFQGVEVAQEGKKALKIDLLAKIK